MAAAGIYALEHNVGRLGQDHLHAKILCEELSKKSFVQSILPVETNIVIVEIKAPCTAKAIAAALREKEILAIAISATQVRLVTHLDISDEMIKRTSKIIREM